MGANGYNAPWSVEADQASEGIIAEWEKVASGTHRLRVRGGWLYKVIDHNTNGVSVTFVPNAEEPRLLTEFGDRGF